MIEKIELAFEVCKTDKLFHGYASYYEKFLKEKPKSILEIGISQGRSLAAWKLLFPEADITGIDLTKKNFIPYYMNLSEASIHLGDSTDSKFARKINKTFDIIIDDGSHFYKDIIKTFINFKDKFTKYYIIEDAMYKQDFVVSYFNRLGFNDIKIFNSNVKNVKVKKQLVTRKPGNDIVYVDLKFIVISPIQKLE